MATSSSSTKASKSSSSHPPLAAVDPEVTAGLTSQQMKEVVYLKTWVFSSEASAVVARNRDWCTDRCIRRYTAAGGWKWEKAKKMLKETLKWREEAHPEKLSPANFPDICSRGMPFMYWNGYDQHGHPILYVHSRLHDAKLDRQQRLDYSLFMLEKGIALMDTKHSKKEHIEQWVIVVDEAGRASRNNDLKLLRKLGPLMFNHYVERLYRIYVIRPTAAFAALVKIVSLFIDDHTKSKLALSSKDNEAVNKKVAEEKGDSEAMIEEDQPNSPGSSATSSSLPTSGPRSLASPLTAVQGVDVTNFPQLLEDIGVENLQVSFGGKQPDITDWNAFHQWIAEVN